MVELKVRFFLFLAITLYAAVQFLSYKFLQCKDEEKSVSGRVPFLCVDLLKHDYFFDRNSYVHKDVIISISEYSFYYLLF